MIKQGDIVLVLDSNFKFDGLKTGDIAIVKRVIHPFICVLTAPTKFDEFEYREWNFWMSKLEKIGEL